ncbi:hypothetical protein [Clostridium botulinum]|nr:hypothetical protein [Clostridium botulinum]
MKKEVESKERTTILKGDFEEAVYRDQEIEEYAHNAFSTTSNF